MTTRDDRLAQAQQALQAGDADWAGAVMRSHFHAGYRAALRDTGLFGAVGVDTPD